MTNRDRLINTFISETLAKIDTDTTKTWDEFYANMSDDAQSGYEWLIDDVCSCEGLERAQKYIDVDTVLEAIVDLDKTNIDDLEDYVIEQISENMEWAASQEEYERYEYECEQADLAYKRMVEERLGMC